VRDGEEVEAMPFNGILLPGLKEARLREALTQDELAAKAGVARTTLARVETGAGAAPATARKLAAALGVAPSALMAPATPQGKALAA
jgi:transcriptional regulator with XRE-family HTH domain